MSEGTGWNVAKWAWENRDKIKETLAGLFTWFQGTKKLLILGPGGTRKTTLGKYLAGEYDFLLDVPGGYEESIGLETYKIKGKPEAEAVVPPGQKHRRDSTWDELHADLAAAKFSGVILVSSYGHHSLGPISYKEHQLYANDKKDFLRAYLEAGRTEELAVLRRLAPFVKSHPGRVWMLTLVTKQDLWWPRQTEVEQHYKEGEYGAAIKALQDNKPRHFRHEYAFASLVIGNFLTGVGELLLPNAKGYDQKQQVGALRRLFETIDALHKWGSGK